MHLGVIDEKQIRNENNTATLQMNFILFCFFGILKDHWVWEHLIHQQAFIKSTVCLGTLCFVCFIHLVDGVTELILLFYLVKTFRNVIACIFEHRMQKAVHFLKSLYAFLRKYWRRGWESLREHSFLFQSSNLRTWAILRGPEWNAGWKISKTTRNARPRNANPNLISHLIFKK